MAHRIIKRERMQNTFKFTFILNSSTYKSASAQLTRGEVTSLLERSAPRQNAQNFFSVGLQQPAHAFVRDMSVLTKSP